MLSLLTALWKLHPWPGPLYLTQHVPCWHTREVSLQPRLPWFMPLSSLPPFVDVPIPTNSTPTSSWQPRFPKHSSCTWQVCYPLDRSEFNSWDSMTKEWKVKKTVKWLCTYCIYYCTPCLLLSSQVQGHLSLQSILLSEKCSLVQDLWWEMRDEVQGAVQFVPGAWGAQ